MSDVGDAIFLIDEIELLPDVLDEFLDAFRARYLPGAEERGMELLHTWVTPPQSPPDSGSTVIVIWSLAGIPGFWRMRSQNAAPDIAEWWRGCERFCVRRTRRFAVTPESRPGFLAAGRVHA